MKMVDGSMSDGEGLWHIDRRVNERFTRYEN